MEVKKANPKFWRALNGMYHSPHTTVKEYFDGKRNDVTPISDSFYTEWVNWSDPNGGAVRLLIEVSRGIRDGAPVFGTTVLVVTNYVGCKEKYFVAIVPGLCQLWHNEHQARWYCKDLLNAEYHDVIKIPESVIKNSK